MFPLKSVTLAGYQTKQKIQGSNARFRSHFGSIFSMHDFTIFLDRKMGPKRIGETDFSCTTRQHCNSEIVIFSIQTSSNQINGELSMNKEEMYLAVQSQ